MSHEIDDPRRQWLIQALATGLFGAALPHAQAQGFNIFGTKPAKLPEGQSIYSIAGDVKVNDKPASLSTSIKPGDVVQTGTNSQLIFVVNTHSMILRGDSRLVIEKPPQLPADNSVGSFLIGGLRLITGKFLSVSRNSPMRVTTSTATIGIRGTGFYVESDPEQTYFCTCYGVTEVQATDDPQSREQVAAAHHDRPLYIVKDGGAGKNIRNAPFINHSDQELSLIETLVGRKVPFVFSKDAYSAPRRSY
ncbi:MAG: FecR domain-containing protein [Rhodoferax sp.]|nr:FecR domain-containing protein [Rhodoferax sp.]